MKVRACGEHRGGEPPSCGLPQDILKAKTRDGGVANWSGGLPSAMAQHKSQLSKIEVSDGE